jgi:hypothetical protein
MNEDKKICKNCEHWDTPGRFHYFYKDGWGQCGLVDTDQFNTEYPVDSLAFALGGADYGDNARGELSTSPNFGCNQFEGKEPA